MFVNAVSSLRRVAAILKVLGLPALALHAQQQQRQRLKALDRFKANPQVRSTALTSLLQQSSLSRFRCYGVWHVRH